MLLKMNSFDCEQYILNYPDLSHFTKEMAQQHFKKYGQFEGRTDQKDKYKYKITVITPCSRPENLLKLKESIDFEFVCEWIIVYDSTKLSYDNSKFEDHDFISEYSYGDLGGGKYGYPQRNYALSVVKNKESYIYFLDDDNIIHPDLYTLSLIHNKIYTFNQLNKDSSLRLKGNRIKVTKIDIAMYLIYYPLINHTLFETTNYYSDGTFIVDCYNANKKSWIYIDKSFCYYNKL